MNDDKKNINKSDPVAEETQLEEPKSEAVKAVGEDLQSEEVGTPKAEGADQTHSEDQKTTEELEEGGPSGALRSDEAPTQDTPGKWYVVHTYSGHENKVAAALKQRIEAEHLEDKIIDVLVPTQNKIEIKGGKKYDVKEKIFPGYILVRMILDDNSWLSVRTIPGVTSFVGMGNKPTVIPDSEVATIIQYSKIEQPSFKQVFEVGDTLKIVDGPFAEMIGKIDSVDQEKGKVRVLVSIFGRETPVELDFLQVQKI